MKGIRLHLDVFSGFGLEKKNFKKFKRMDKKESISPQYAFVKSVYPFLNNLKLHTTLNQPGSPNGIAVPLIISQTYIMIKPKKHEKQNFILHSCIKLLLL